MKKERLMSPGPTQVPEESLLTLARQVTHHRTPQFETLFQKTRLAMGKILRTEGDVFFITGSGTASMETALMNIVAPGETILILASGKFSQRWAEMGEVFGAKVIICSVPWGEPFRPDVVADILRAHPETVAVFGTLTETSTGVCHPIAELGRTIRENSAALFVVDGISGIGADRFEMDAWSVDLAVIGSQKALMGISGGGFVAVSPRAWEKIEQTPRRGFYFDLIKYRKSAQASTTPFTPAKPILEGLAVSLDAILAEGIETVWRRTSLLAEAVRAGIDAIGLARTTAFPADSMTAVFFPETCAFNAKRFMNEIHECYGIKFAGGQGEWRGKIFRMAHFGLIDEFDVLGTLGSIELALIDAGYPAEPGRGVAAAQRVFLAARQVLPRNISSKN